MQLGEHQTAGGADAKAEDTAKDDPRKALNMKSENRKDDDTDVHTNQQH